MTKKRIGTIYGSPIIEGDKNLKTSNEIHVSELGGGNSGSERYVYFKWQESKPDILQELSELLGVFNCVVLITDIYSNTLAKNINVVIPTISYGSGAGNNSKVSGLAATNLSLTNPMNGTETDFIGYMQLMLQIDDSPHKEVFEFLLAHKVSEEEFFKGVQAYIP